MAAMNTDNGKSQTQIIEDQKALAFVPEFLFQKLTKGTPNAKFLGWSEFKTLCIWAGVKKEEVALKLWEDADKDNSNTLSQKEFYEFCRRPKVWVDIKAIAARLRSADFNLQAKVAEHLFHFLDSDNNHKINLKEFQILCKAAGETSERNVMKIWSNAHPDPTDGTLNKEAFSKFTTNPKVWPTILKIHRSLLQLTHLQNKAKVEKVSKALFKRCDESGRGDQKEDNMVQLEEFWKMCKLIGMNQDYCLKQFRQFDTNGDNALSKKEFAVFIQRKEFWPHLVNLEAMLSKKGYIVD
eukprot:jgi/Bigna1/90880/estExt_fgenesh1_pg.C_820007